MDAPDATFTRLDAPDAPGAGRAETDFEKRRGISHLDLRTGLAQVHVAGLGGDGSGGDAMPARIALLRELGGAGVSIDFLKLTPTGMSFVVRAEEAEAVRRSLEGAAFAIEADRAILLVHAVNMRDEDGMIAGILRRAIGSGITVDHASDMHDRMLLVLRQDHAERLARLLLEDAPNV